MNVSSSQIHDDRYGVNTGSNGGISLLNNVFANNASGAVSLGGGLTNFIHSGNTATGGPMNGIVVNGGRSANQTWTAGDLPYIIGDIAAVSVASGTRLTIEAGAVVKFTWRSGLYVSGILDARGTPTSTIYFTSITDDTADGDTNGDTTSTPPYSGDWDTIKFNPGASGTIAYATVSYGGWGSCYECSRANIYNNGGSLTLEGAEIAHGTYYGVYQPSGNSTITSSSNIHDMESYGNKGVYLTGGSMSISSGAAIHDNA